MNSPPPRSAADIVRFGTQRAEFDPLAAIAAPNQASPPPGAPPDLRSLPISSQSPRMPQHRTATDWLVDVLTPVMIFVMGVDEWCHDVYSESYYAQSESANPRGPAAGEKRVLRGGSWRSSEEACRCAARHSETARFADACFGSDGYGFRCVKAAPPAP